MSASLFAIFSLLDFPKVNIQHQISDLIADR